MSLTDKLPQNIYVSGTAIPIQTDFRAGILYDAVCRADYSPEKRMLQTLDIYLSHPEQIPICQELFEQINEFYLGGKSELQKKQEAKLRGLSNGKEGISYLIDADLIQAAFLAQYGIDLIDIEYLHWWKFIALLRGLTEEHEIVKIIGYRTMKIGNKLSMEQRKTYQDLQRRYALPDLKKKTADVKETELALVTGTYRG